MRILIRQGRVLDPANGIDKQADVLIDQQGRISRIEQGIAGAERIIDAEGCLVLPGLIDLHVHLREPGQEHKEDLESGTRAAAAGGFTRICCMPNTAPVNDTRAVTEYILNRAQLVGLVHVHPIGAISRGLQGKELAELAEMKQAGIVAASDDGRCLMDAGLMRRALEYASTFELPIIQHCEDERLSQRGAIHEGFISTCTGLSCQPAQAESCIVARDLELVELTGGRYHGAHLSTRQALRLMREAKARGLPVSCEATPHHFSLTDEACRSYDTNTKVNPPLRSRADVDAVKQAIADGTVDAIATDHAPHSILDKEVEYGCAAFGISGIETAVPLSLALYREGVIPLARVVALLTCGPARVLGLPGGNLAPGRVADVTIVNPDLKWTVDASRLLSKGKNTPFAGQELTGAVTHTIVNGEIVFQRG
jgi:dihydroorotase